MLPPPEHCLEDGALLLRLPKRRATTLGMPVHHTGPALQCPDCDGIYVRVEPVGVLPAVLDAEE